MTYKKLGRTKLETVATVSTVARTHPGAGNSGDSGDRVLDLARVRGYTTAKNKCILYKYQGLNESAPQKRPSETGDARTPAAARPHATLETLCSQCGGQDATI